MQDNQFASPQPWSIKREENNSDASNLLQQENDKILIENIDLKKKLEKEKLFHSTLYKQWADLNASIVTKNHELEKLRLRRNTQVPIYKYAFFGLLLITIILAVSAYNLSANRKDAGAAIQNIETAPGPQNSNSKTSNTTPVKKETSLSNKVKVPAPAASTPVINKIEPSEIKTVVTTGDKKVQGKYRVVSKSYFCNEPDESTRRNTFVLPDDTDYGILNAIDDKNGFIYIVFTNHAGRTSKGWISKSDLEQLN